MDQKTVPAMRADFVIVGGGTAGCVLANRLSACGRYSVILIEAGGADHHPWLHIPIGYGKVTGDPRFDWRFSTVPQPQLDGRRIGVPRGKVLGGSSATNGLLYVRGQREDFDGWAAQGCIGWGYDDVLPYFRRSEDQRDGADAWHGVGGPLAVRDPVSSHPLCDAFIRGWEVDGLPSSRDFNGAEQEGVGYYQMTVRGTRRCSTAQGFLREARKRPNLQVLTRMRVKRIGFEGRRADSVEVERDSGQAMRIAAEREVILSAGALASPQLLMLSGVGPAAHLREHGIGVLRDSPVGEGLQDHLNVRCTFEATRPVTINDRLRGPVGQAMSGLEYLLLGRGPLTVAAGYAGSFYRADGSRGRPDSQAYLLAFSTTPDGRKLRAESGFMASAYQLRPESRGSIRLASADPHAMPLIDPRYLDSDVDRRMTVAALRRLLRAMAHKPMSDFIKSSYPPFDSSDAELLAHIRAIASPGHHFTSTCRMGVGRDAVVDPRLRVNGLDNLRVADAAIMPSVPSGNTAAPVVMIAEKASDMILEDARNAM
ncbi:MAG: choline dehydrogenase [Sphingomonas sp.]|nr:choline dehydrogenase [Sphingomonas sp.]